MLSSHPDKPQMLAITSTATKLDGGNRAKLNNSYYYILVSN